MSTKFFAFTAILGLSSALRTTITERREVNTECWQTNPGTQFFRCANGYVGCFEKDPCALPPLATTTEKHEMAKPRSYNIYPQSTVDLEDPVPHIDLKKEKGRGIVTTNAIVFDDVPANAKNCQLKWRTDGTEGGSGLAVSGSGLIYSRQLLGFPEEGVPVTFKNLKPFQNTAEEFSPSMDTTGWVGTIDSHNGPSLKCAEQVAVEMYGDDAGGEDDRIFMVNTETNGMYLTYEL